jgi:membrane protein implicated in regulation of membrane protease activity
MDWGVAAKFALIVAALMAAVVFAVFVFDAIWAQIGLIGAVLVFVALLYLVKRWSDRDARRAREKFERG